MKISDCAALAEQEDDGQRDLAPAQILSGFPAALGRIQIAAVVENLIRGPEGEAEPSKCTYSGCLAASDDPADRAGRPHQCPRLGR